jgi:DNA-directed RNA polymerase specialized sigma24 family protein
VHGRNKDKRMSTKYNPTPERERPHVFSCDEKQSAQAQTVGKQSGGWSVCALVEQCRWEIQAYRHGEPSNEAYGLELLRRAIVQGDQAAWAGVQQCFGEFVRSWLHGHPRREVALRWGSEESYVALAFERFWQATAQQQIAFRTLAGALAYLHASLNGALLDTLRTYARPREVPSPEPGAPGEPFFEEHPDSSEVWEILQRVLPSEREQRLAYLLYHCHLKPREIVRFCQEEWPDVQEIYRLRRNILERLLRNTDQLRRQFNLQEQV